MDMNIAGSGNIAPGEYDNIKASGSCKIKGPIRCKSMVCAGSIRCYGEIDASEKISISGSSRIEGDLKSGKLSISGSTGIDGNCIVREDIKISGSSRCGGNIKANKLYLAGSSQAANIEAEEVHIDGKVICPGLINAEKIEINIHAANSEIGSIGGSIIEITRKKHIGNIGFFFFKKKEARGYLTVNDSIEGDEISLAYVKANNVVGRIVKIGPGCSIKQVRYSESIEIAPDAEVGEQIKI